jgi:YHS domain-containing protein
MKNKITTAFAIALMGVAISSCATSGGAKPYPLDTCIVSDNKLGSMGTPVTKVHQGQEVKFCCEPCVDEFNENPAKYMAKLSR